MARFITRIATLCRPRPTAAEFLLRRFRMMRVDPDPDDEACGPGWYESSRELETGLQVREAQPGDALLAEWMEAWRRPPAGLAVPDRAQAAQSPAVARTTVTVQSDCATTCAETLPR